MRRKEAIERAAEVGITLDHRYEGCLAPLEVNPYLVDLYGEDFFAGKTTCTRRAYEFLISGKSIVVHVPNCYYWGASHVAKYLSKVFGIEILHTLALEKLLKKNGRARDFEVRGTLTPAYEVGHGAHAYYCLRDVIAVVPKRHPRCKACGRGYVAACRHGDAGTRRWLLSREEYAAGIWICSGPCMVEYRRESLRLYEEQCQREKLEQLRSKQEMKWIRQGHKTLKEIRQLLSHPGALQSQSLESRQVESSQGL